MATMFVIRRKTPAPDGGLYFVPGAAPAKQLRGALLGDGLGACFWQFRDDVNDAHAAMPDRDAWEVLPEDEAERLDRAAAATPLISVPGA